MRFRDIARTLNVNNTTVLRWVRSIGMSLKTYISTQLPENPRNVDFIEIDEMRHFTVKKTKTLGLDCYRLVYPRSSWVLYWNQRKKSLLRINS